MSDETQSPDVTPETLRGEPSDVSRETTAGSPSSGPGDDAAHAEPVLSASAEDNDASQWSKDWPGTPDGGSTPVSDASFADSVGDRVEFADQADVAHVRPAAETAAQPDGAVSRETIDNDIDGDQPRSGMADPVSRETAGDELPVDRRDAASTADDASTKASETASTAETGEASTTSADDVSRETTFDTPIAREAQQAVHVLNVRQEQWPTPDAPRVMTVANQKGGVGKTTTAVNIAAAMALHGLRVLLIDLDPQGNASTALGIEHGVGTPSIYDVLLGGEQLREVAQVAEFAPNLHCVPATLDLAGADIELTSQVAREYRLQKALQTYLADGERAVDYVLIDCPPSLGLLTLNALVAGNEMLIPIQCEYYALEGLAQLLSTVELVTSHLNPTLRVSTVLLTMYDSRTRLADQVADEVREHFGELVLSPTIPRNVRVSEAPGFGQTVITYDAGSRGAIGYLQAAREIADRGSTVIAPGQPAANDQE